MSLIIQKEIKKYLTHHQQIANMREISEILQSDKLYDI